MTRYLTSVGMEVHAELTTKSKMFCRCQVAFGGEPNTRVCPVCMGLPGALPVPNRVAIEMVLITALALDCEIAYDSVFHRKNYFYPDLPKGFQVSQYGETNPLGYYGQLVIPVDGGTKTIKIRRVHLEEDTGKLMHLPSGGSGVDYNRSGVPLMEIVSGFPPDIESPIEAKEYLVQLRHLLVYLGVCNGKMEEGSMRCEPNISVRPEGQAELGTKSELKNLNSFRSVQQGILFETGRQSALLERGEKVLQETRGWNDSDETSFAMRIKEAENDYRYFADPDLVPMHFEKEYIEELRRNLPELPLSKSLRFQKEMGLSEYDANLLIAEKPWAEFFEAAVAKGGDPKLVCNWMNSDFAKMLNDTGQVIAEPDETHPLSKVRPEHLVELVGLIQNNTISGKIAKDVFREVFEKGEAPGSVVKSSGQTLVSDAGAIETICQEVIVENAEAVTKYKSGQASVMGFLIGQAMKKSQGRANPGILNETMRRLLEEL